MPHEPADPDRHVQELIEQGATPEEIRSYVFGSEPELTEDQRVALWLRAWTTLLKQRRSADGEH